jgi:hypothetical protein
MFLWGTLMPFARVVSSCRRPHSRMDPTSRKVGGPTEGGDGELYCGYAGRGSVEYIVRVEGEWDGVPWCHLNGTGAIDSHCVKCAYPDGVTDAFSRYHDHNNLGYIIT